MPALARASGTGSGGAASAWVRAASPPRVGCAAGAVAGAGFAGSVLRSARPSARGGAVGFWGAGGGAAGALDSARGAGAGAGAGSGSGCRGAAGAGAAVVAPGCRSAAGAGAGAGAAAGAGAVITGGVCGLAAAACVGAWASATWPLSLTVPSWADGALRPRPTSCSVCGLRPNCSASRPARPSTATLATARIGHRWSLAAGRVGGLGKALVSISRRCEAGSPGAAGGGSSVPPAASMPSAWRQACICASASTAARTFGSGWAASSSAASW